jgi:peptide/nickel transport system substrate-binding protein
MRRLKASWYVLCGLMVVALLASCGPSGSTTTSATTTKPSGGTTTAATTKPPTATTTIAAPGGAAGGKLSPKYGGTVTTAQGADPTAWDPTLAQAIRVTHMQFTSNELLQGDWTKGPQGSGLTNWEWGWLGDMSLEVGELAESWELPDATTIIIKVRKGVKYFLNPKAEKNSLVNGREVTAQDVVWNMEMQYNYPGVWQSTSYPPAKAEKVTGKVLPGGDPRRPTSFRAVDKYTVEVKVPEASQGLMLMEIVENAYTNPPEIWTSGGDMTKWQNVIGSGPFFIDDYVSGSSITFKKNPNYFETDPLYKGNQWPYVDNVRLLIIADLATRLTALRTGKIDLLQSVSHDDAFPVINSVKDIKTTRRIATTWVLSGRLDKENLPYKDRRVRVAMNLAVDKQAILKDYFKGDGELLAYPYPPLKSWEKYYTPLEQLPAETQEFIKGGNIEKAKQLLKEAGYPNGFRASVDVWSQQPQPDEVSMLASYLSKVGIQLDIKVREVGLWNSMDAANSQEDMWYGQAKGIWAPYEQLMTGMAYSNDAIIRDPYYTKVGEVIGRDWPMKNTDNYFKTLKESGVYELNSAWAVFMPSPYVYQMWWPWVENWFGIGWTGWAGINDWYKGIWTNTEMKRSMGF